ncbi:MAG TPA: hypothetical protein VGM78_01315, partial [Ilumatobacteraceae bacterium]
MTAPASPELLVARVVPDVTGLDRQFDYIVPDALRDRVALGTLVRVSLAGRRVGGWVVALGPPDPDLAVDRLLPIAKVTGVGPAADIIELARWATRRWAGRMRSFLVTASPPGAVLGLGSPTHGGPVPEPTDVVTARLLADGGGLLRLPPANDPLPVILAANRLGPVLVVVPSVVQARLLGSRLRRAGRTVAVVGGEWAMAAAGVDVVIGARAAVWAPCPDLAAIVVLDEHDEALQEERQPTWHARDVALQRAASRGVPALLVSPAPSATATALVPPSRYRRPSIDAERSGWPLVEIVDRSREEPWQKSMATSPLIRQLRDHTRVVVCVLNTAGRARLLACRTCRSLQRCELCEAAVHQRDDSMFACARCATVRPPVCQACGASAFAALRVGVARLRDELEAAANRPAIAVTGASTDVEPVGDAGVYVGTEAVLHRVRRADTVAFVDFDSELLAPRYRASEQAMTLLARAARLVGGRAGGGRLLIQTFIPRHEVLDAVLHSDPGRLMSKELARRQQLGFPPAAALAVVSGARATDFAAALALREVQWAEISDGSVMLRAPSWD